MKKILLIIQREYLSRVKKKSFVVMTILGPILMIGLIFAQFWIKMIPEEKQKILVVDESKLFTNKLENSSNSTFTFSNNSLIDEQNNFFKTDYNVILYIPANIIDSQKIQIFYKKQPGLSLQDYISTVIEKKLEDMKLIASGINANQLKSIKTKLNVTNTKIEKNGIFETKDNEVSMILGFLAGILIYFFIFLYGAQVMRGVIEEKTSRIIEVIISSVKPFELMMGKIIGIAMVGLTQFLLWIILSAVGTTLVGNALMKDDLKIEAVEQTYKSNVPQQKDVFKELDSQQKTEIINSFFEQVNFPVMIGSFLFYFLFGYLLYGALFAAVGSAVDSEADTQQFMLPITVPLILAFVFSQNVMTNPESALAFWLSIFPLTSPVIMMVRIPFGVPYFDLFLSMFLLVAGFIGVTWLSGKIYRTGILMYGKKNSYKELWKWLFYRA
ncbi:MAG: ABC transporter permease [Bacteroidia bacterium]|nr:ABC transporter permease [Bacteroidia bacterium]MCZ2249014.1 ABC transporter permease [Bacteroidia bacterium]